MPASFSARLRKLRTALAEKDFDSLLVSYPENRRYLSGFTGSSGYLLISHSRALLATDSRYFEQVVRECPDYELFQLKAYSGSWLPDAASQIDARKLAFEAAYLPFASYKQFVDAFSAAFLQVQFLPESGIVEGLRWIKEPEELAAIARAASLVHRILADVVPAARPGMTEKELAWQLERALRENGSEVLPFDVIFASGPNTALPHAHPSDRKLLSGEPVVIDAGARVSGYCSDVTRTFCVGRSDSMFHKVHDVVLGAQLTAIATIEAGMTGAQADSLARTVIQQAGYGDYFGHGLGHGLGLETHEAPRLGANSEDVLADGMVFTVEPGIYLPGWGGVRIEDTVTLQNGRVKVLQ